MSDSTTMIRGPIEVLYLAGLCGSGEVGRFNLAQVRFGRDAEGCWAAASNTQVLGIARWEATTAVPVGIEFGVPSAILTESLLADADEFEIGPGEMVIHDAVPTRVGFTPPTGRWIPAEARCGYERAMREPVTTDIGQRSILVRLSTEWCDLHRSLGLMAVHDDFSIRPYLAMMTGKPGTYHGPLWCFEAIPDVRRVTVWACVMPISE